MVEVPTVYITAAVILLLFAGVLLRRKGRTRVDKCVIWVFAGYALHYARVLPRWTAGHPIRCRGRCSAGWGQVPLRGFPDRMYTDDGHAVPNDESAVIRQRLSRGLRQVGYFT